MLALLAALTSAGRFDSKMPDFSWDTFPVAYHGANYNTYSNESIALLAKFPMVTLEKCQGWKTLDPPCNGYNCDSCCEEDVYTTVGSQIKAINPRVKVIAYLHSNKAMGWYRVTRSVNNTDACYNGDRMNETSCVPANENEYYYDFRKAPARAAYTDACLSMTKTGAVDGCFVDGCVKVEAPIGKEEEAAFVKAKMDNLGELQEKVPGPLICGSGGTFYPTLAASAVQAFSAKHAGWWGNMMHLNTSASQGHLFEAHGGQVCYNDDITSSLFLTEYAAFLMFAQRWSYLICGAWCGSDPVWPKAFDIPLGKPVGNASSADGIVWTRRFESGTEVFFNKTNTTGWVHWGKAARDYIAKNY